MGIRRLPFELGKALGEEDRVFARPARHLKHQPSFRQPFAEDLRDIFAIARHRGRRAARVSARGGFVEAPLVCHQARPRASSSNRFARTYISARVSVNIPSAKAISGSVSIAGLTPSEPSSPRPSALTAINASRNSIAAGEAFWLSPCVSESTWL